MKTRYYATLVQFLKKNAASLLLTKLAGLAAFLMTTTVFAGEANRPLPTIDWKTTIDKFRFDADKFVGQRLTVKCPPAPRDLRHGVIHGVDVYPSETPICLAALHAGEISAEKGGTVTLQLNPGRKEYTGSERNGVKTSPLPATKRSFVFINKSTAQEQAKAQLANLPRIDWSTKFTRSGFAYRDLIGQQFSFRCPPAPDSLQSRIVYGTDVYDFPSHVGLAALHAGKLTQEGGVVTVQINGKPGRLTGSIRNGIETRSKNGGDRSIVFVATRAVDSPEDPEK